MHVCVVSRRRHRQLRDDQLTRPGRLLRPYTYRKWQVPTQFHFLLELFRTSEPLSEFALTMSILYSGTSIILTNGDGWWFELSNNFYYQKCVFTHITRKDLTITYILFNMKHFALQKVFYSMKYLQYSQFPINRK